MTDLSFSKSLLRRPALLLTLLFVVALCLSIAWQWRVSRALSSSATTPLAATNPANVRQSARSVTEIVHGGGSDVDPATGGASGPVSAELPAVMSDEDRAALESATFAPDVDERVMAIAELRDAYSVESIDALGRFLVNDPEPRVRIAAAESLRILAANDADPSGRIRALLHGAMYDRDRLVAEQVQRALDEIESMH